MINKLKHLFFVSICLLFFNYSIVGQTTYTVTNPNGNFTYAPSYLEVNVDDTIIVQSSSFAGHPFQQLSQNNYCSGNNSGSILINYSNTYKITATTPGFYYYGCVAHGSLGELLTIHVNCNTTSTPTAAASQTVAPNTTLGGLNVTGSNLQWYTSSNLAYTGSCPIPNTTNVSDGTTYYVSQTIGGCEGPRTDVTVYVCQSPNISNQSVNSSSVCVGANISYSVSATGTNLTYQWMKDDIIIPSENTSVLNLSNVNTAAQGVYNCVLTTACGTLSTNSATLTVNVLPTLTANNATICAGDTYTFNPGGAVTYTYSSGSSTVAPVGSDTYTINGTDVNGCVNSTTCSITVNSLPALTVSDGTICAGDTYTFSPGGAVTYSYSNGSDIVSPSTQTTYTISGTDANGCVNHVSATVFVNTPVTPSISAVGLTLTSDPAISYQWYLEGNLINGATSQTIAVIQNGNYTVKITDANGCSATSANFNVTSVGVQNINESNSLLVYPNPTSGIFEIQFNSTTEKTVTLSVTDILGNLIYSEVIELSGNRFHKKYDLSSFTDGIYFIKVSDNTNRSRVVKILLNK